MRIVVVAPPRSGNHWVKCLLSRVYGLQWRGGDRKAITRADDYRAHVASGGFPDNSIFHQHCRFRTDLADAVAETPAHLVTVVRNPYDAFLSYYHWVQVRSPHDDDAGERSGARPRSRMIGRALDDPEVLAFLADDYGAMLMKANDWLHSGRALVVRFEELNRDPVGTIERLTDQIAPVARATIEGAAETCRIENVKQRRKQLARTVRHGAVGESKQALGSAHLEIFQREFGEQIRSLGYEVREPEAAAVAGGADA
ncbi:MAG TPA: sulfotransferase domain-containing protein [Thermomicrobiales bacterium]|nr:sulfotransferase domain-containing protein [Thermomicrobiales bacterium]